MTTFSQLVDEVAFELRRLDATTDLVGYLNKSLREAFYHPKSGTLGLYGASLFEDSFTHVGNEPYIGQPWNQDRLQNIAAVYNTTTGEYIQQKRPNTAYRPGEVVTPLNQGIYWYRSGPSIVISGINDGDTILLAWYEFAPRFVYYPPGERPSVYDPDANTYSGTEAEQALCTHWLLQRWTEALKDGMKAKLWARMDEQNRSRMAYSSFNDYRLQIWTSESL
jgi:hypothetical protein